MAADGKDAKDGEYEFVPPDFDEEQFIHREIVSFKTTSILFVWGIVAAAVSWGVFVAMGGGDAAWFVGLGICALFGYALKFLFPRLGADISHFKRREWTGTGFLFFFTWLSFFMLAVNPPITDIAPPQVFVHAGPPIQETGAPVTIDVVATDNDKVADLKVTATRDGQPLDLQTTPLSSDHVQTTLPNAAGHYTITATATDPKGHTGRQVANVTIGHVLDATWPNDRTMKAGAQVLVAASDGAHAIPHCAADYDKGRNFECIRLVELRAKDGAPSVAMEWSDADNAWRAGPNFAGWSVGNHTYQAVALYPKHFLGATPVAGGEVMGPSMALNVVAPGGDHAPTQVAEPTARAVLVPGPSLGLVAVALVGIAALARRRMH